MVRELNLKKASGPSILAALLETWSSFETYYYKYYQTNVWNFKADSYLKLIWRSREATCVKTFFFKMENI